MDLMQQVIDGFSTIDVNPSLKQQATEHLRRWLTTAEFAAYRPQLEWLIATKQWAGLLDRFYQILPFGTGGRRGAVGIGPNRMNLWTLGASVQGHCEYLQRTFPRRRPCTSCWPTTCANSRTSARATTPTCPIPCCTCRRKDFAQHAAGVYAANGIRAHILPADSSQSLTWPRPELSFTIRKLAAHGGLNISASHNPPDDNGGKFYDERGGQPVPPDDQIMADLVDQVDRHQVAALDRRRPHRQGSFSR